MQNSKYNTNEKLLEEITSLKAEISNLKKNTEISRIIAENTSDNIAITTFDLKAKYLFVSPSTRKALGYDPEEMIGESFFNYVHPDDKKFVLKLLKKYLKQIAAKILRIDDPNLSETLEYRFRNKAGEWRYLQSSINFVGKNLLAVSRDITEQKETERALKESENRFKALSEATYEAIFISEKGICIEANEAASTMFGYTHDELIGIFGTDVIAPESKALVRKNMLSAYAKPYDAIAQRKDGTKFHAEFHGKMFIYKGRKTRVTAVRDISDRKKAELALKESEEFFKAITENISDVIVIIDQKGNYKYRSASSARVMGYAVNEPFGKNVFDFIVPEDQENLRQQFLFSFHHQGEVIPISFRAYHKDGSIRYLEGTGINLIKNPSIQGIVVNYRDVSERRKAELALKESEEKLRESNKTKDKFFSIIAHDLRSPFNSLLGLSEVLDDNFDHYSTVDQKKIAGAIHKSLQDTYKLLENLLLWSRSQRGVIPFYPDKIKLYSLTSEVCRLLKSMAKNKSITMVNQIPEDLYVEADWEMLSTIMRNLLSNAIKFTPKGGKITIKAENSNPDYVKVSVHDTGVGIPKEKIKSIFTLGEDTSTKGTENEPGSGLGLILCKEFVKKHGGDIWVESQPQKGSSLYFTLPNKPNNKM